ncbi:MAG TPA: hypothetical protein VJM53_09555 [Burkholderiales bacterium]|nr:hypothetical protein [Burkholderiales bacterium]
MAPSSRLDVIIRGMRWATAPVAWRGFKVAAVGFAIFIVAAALMLLAGEVQWPWLSWPVLALGATWGLVGWAIVALGVIGKLRWFYRART